MRKRIHVGLSPLTQTIYAGTLLKSGDTWSTNRDDVTGQACAAVAQRALALGGTMLVTANGEPAYEITVRELTE